MTGDPCPFCDMSTIDDKPVCTTHWKLTDAVLRTNFYAALAKYERGIYKGDSVDAFSKACDDITDMVRERLAESEEANA
jgi:hypothetical protein